MKGWDGETKQDQMVDIGGLVDDLMRSSDPGSRCTRGYFKHLQDSSSIFAGVLNVVGY